MSQIIVKTVLLYMVHLVPHMLHCFLKSRIIRPKNLYSPKPRSDLEIVHVVSINDSMITLGCIMILIKGANNRKFTHQDYQNELVNLMANEVLRTKLNAIKQCKFYSTMSDEYTDVANKEQLSFCLRWIDENLCAKEDFLGYYELLNIKSDTIVAVIRDCLIRFELPIQNLRGQTYDGASNMMGKRSGVAQQIFKDQLKVPVPLPHSLSLAIKDANKLCSILNEVMGSVGEIIVLIKFSPKRERMLGTINENVEVSSENDDGVLEPGTALAKL